MNIKKALLTTAELKEAGIATPELDAKVLLLHALEKDSVFLITNPSRPLTNLEYSRFRRYVRKRKKGIPVAYITGHKEFFGLDFKVNKNTLIPRPETEWLVEKGSEFLKRRTDSPSLSVLDMGTGSGCIIISLAKECEKAGIRNVYFYASDISKKALSIAKINASKNQAENIKFLHSDLFQNKRLHKKFDLIIANLPYVPDRKIEEFDARRLETSVIFEPRNAIFAGPKGMDVINRFFEEAKNKVGESGLILMEVDCRNAKPFLQIAKKAFPLAKIEIQQDLSDLNRYLSILIKN